MDARKSGGRHPLLLYRRTMDRIWKSTLFLGLIVAAAAGFSLIRETSIFGFSSNVWLFAIAIVAIVLSVFSFFARYMSYIQAHKSHLVIVTPFLRLKISYKRLRSVQPVLVQQLFPKGGSSWSQRSFLEPLYGKTALVMELRSYPLSPALLKLFLPAQMFSPRSTGFVIIIPDWMKFSTELDSLRGTWMQRGQTSGRRGQL